jgi:hypothetical protein
VIAEDAPEAMAVPAAEEAVSAAIMIKEATGLLQKEISLGSLVRNHVDLTNVQPIPKYE